MQARRCETRAEGPPPNSDEWLEWRYGGLGASECMECLTDPAAVAMRKIHRVETEPADPDAAQWGHDVESAILRSLARKRGWDLAPPVALSHPERPWIRASFDTCIVGSEEPVDAKNRIIFAAKEFGDDGDDAEEGTCPAAIRLQLMQQVYVKRGVTGRDIRQGWVAACIGGRPPIGLRVEYDADLYERRILPKLDALWAMIARGETPPMSGTPGCTAAVDGAWPEADGGAVELGPEADLLVDEHKATGAALSAAKAAHQAARNRLCALLGPAARGLTDAWRVSWLEYEGRETVDLDALRLAAPELAEKFIRRGDSFRRLSIAARKRGRKAG